MAQTKVNGSLEEFQALTGNLDHLVLVSGGPDVHDLGTVAGNAAVMLEAVSSVANAVILEKDASNTQILYVAVESNGSSLTDMADAINGTSTFSAATVTAGSYAVV